MFRVKNHSNKKSSKPTMIKEQSDSVAKGENRMALVLPTVSNLHHFYSILLFIHTYTSLGF